MMVLLKELMEARLQRLAREEPTAFYSLVTLANGEESEFATAMLSNPSTLALEGFVGGSGEVHPLVKEVLPRVAKGKLDNLKVAMPNPR